MQDAKPEHVVVRPVGHANIIRTNRTKLLWALVCLIAPTALFFVSLFGYGLVNYLLGSEESAGRAILNVLMFIVGVVVVLTWLPGIIGGIILLATRKKVN